MFKQSVFFFLLYEDLNPMEDTQQTGFDVNAGTRIINRDKDTMHHQAT